MTIQFHETRMGQRFIDGTMPRLAKAMEKIAASLEEMREDARAVPPTDYPPSEDGDESQPTRLSDVWQAQDDKFQFARLIRVLKDRLPWHNDIIKVREILGLSSGQLDDLFQRAAKVLEDKGGTDGSSGE